MILLTFTRNSSTTITTRPMYTGEQGGVHVNDDEPDEPRLDKKLLKARPADLPLPHHHLMLKMRN